MTSPLTPEDIRHCRAIALAGRQRVEEIINEVAAASGVSRARLVGRQRGAASDRARQIVMFIARREGIPEATTAAALNRERSTISHGAVAEARRRAEETP